MKLITLLENEVLNNETWYHGAKHEKQELSYNPQGRGEQAWGAGIYLTNNIKRAIRTYAGPDGYIHFVRTTVNNPFSIFEPLSQTTYDNAKRADLKFECEPGDDQLNFVGCIRRNYGKHQLTPILQHLGFDSLYTFDNDPQHRVLVVYDAFNTHVQNVQPVRGDTQK
jgi:hypothetical protein